MFPLLAIGAAALVTGAIVAGSSASSSTDGTRVRRQAKADPQDIASPQSYIVTPISDPKEGSRLPTLTLVEAVKRFIV